MPERFERQNRSVYHRLAGKRTRSRRSHLIPRHTVSVLNYSFTKPSTLHMSSTKHTDLDSGHDNLVKLTF